MCLHCSGSHALWGSRATRSQEEAWPGQTTWSSQKDIPYHAVSWPVYKWGSWLWAVNRCSGMGTALLNEWRVTVLCITCFSWILFLSLPFLLQLLVLWFILIQHWSALISTHKAYVFLILLSIRQGWSEKAAPWYLSCHLRLNCNNTIPEFTKIMLTMEKVEITEVM